MSPLRAEPGKGSRRLTFTNHGYADTTVYLTEPGIDGHAAGAFTIDFADYPDGPIPAETGLRDNFLDDPRNEDELGIRDGMLAIVEFRGPEQAFYDDNAGGGRRAYAWRNTVTLTDNVSSPVEPPLWGVNGDEGGSAVLHVNNDYEGSDYVGMAIWFIGPPFNWVELGPIGRKQEQFAYSDIYLSSTMPEEGDDIFFRSVGGQVALEWNGETVCGPVDIPAGLVGSAIHGVQIDIGEDADEAVGMVEGITITTDSTPLTARVPPPVGAPAGIPVETASATTINVPYPASGIGSGDSLYCIVATKNGGTFSASGWNLVAGSNFGVGGGIQVGVLSKTATGSESGSLTVTKSTAGIMAGGMIRVTGDRRTAAAVSGQGNSSASTSLPSPAGALYSPFITLLWIAATDIDTNIAQPSGYFPFVSGVSGSQAIRLCAAGAYYEAIPDYPGPIFSAYENPNFPAQTGTAAGSTTSAVGLLVLQAAAG